MGTGKSKSRSGSNIKVPNDYKLIKLVSLNVDLRNSINLKKNIKNITDYIFKKKNSKDKDIDIICLYNFNDTVSLYNLIKHVKKEAVDRNVELYFAPEYDDIDENQISLLTLPFSKGTKNLADMYFPHLLISRFPIKFYSKENLSRTQTAHILCANITVYDKLITVVVASLSKDLESIGISNKDKRCVEMIRLKKIINTNNRTIYEDFNSMKTDINIIFCNANFDEQDEEFEMFIKTSRTVDIHRYMNENETIMTGINNKRDDFVFFALTDDIFDSESPFNKDLMEANTVKDILSLIFKRYSFHCFSINSDKDINILENYPIETVFMFKL